MIMGNDYKEFKKFQEEHKKQRQAQIKRTKRVLVASSSLFLAITIALISTLGAYNWSKENEDVKDETAIIEKSTQKGPKSKQQAYRDMQKVLKTKLTTYKDYYTDPDGKKRKYSFAREEDVLKLSGEMAIVLEDYFEACGAKHWSRDDTKQFWPKDIEYIVTAIAYKESTYRVDLVSEKGCQGITGIDETELMDSLDNWLIPHTWGDDMNHISFDVDKVDMFNPTTNLEYMYYNIGYNLVHWYKKDMTFEDKDGKTKCIWDTVPYSDEMQKRMIIATHLFGIGNMLDSIYQRENEDDKIVPIDDYIYCDYVEVVLDKTDQLINKYGNNYTK